MVKQFKDFTIKAKLMRSEGKEGQRCVCCDHSEGKGHIYSMNITPDIKLMIYIAIQKYLKQAKKEEGTFYLEVYEV